MSNQLVVAWCRKNVEGGERVRNIHYIWENISFTFSSNWGPTLDCYLMLTFSDRFPSSSAFSAKSIVQNESGISTSRKKKARVEGVEKEPTIYMNEEAQSYPTDYGLHMCEEWLQSGSKVIQALFHCTSSWKCLASLAQTKQSCPWEILAHGRNETNTVLDGTYFRKHA